jgi:hypothetical protein
MAKERRNTVSVRISKEANKEAGAGAGLLGITKPEFISLAIMEKAQRVIAEELARRVGGQKPPPQQPPPPRRGKGGPP